MSTTTLFLAPAPHPPPSPRLLPLNSHLKPKPQLILSRPFLSPRPFPSLTTSPFSLKTQHQTPCLQSPQPTPTPPQNPHKPLPRPRPLPNHPLSICKWSLVVSLALALILTQKTVSALLNPFFWTYFSFTRVFWPYIAAVSFGAFGLYCFYKHCKNQASVLQQLAIVTSTITWLTLAPPSPLQWVLDGWPIALFFVYHYFFFFEPSVWKRLYGDLYPCAHDPKWDVSLPKPFQFTFFGFVLIGHFLAAYEGPELQLISRGWADFGAWVLVLVMIFMRYHSVLYLAKYSEKVVEPTAVVQFGPYRWVRHPIYASMMLLFTLHCITLRAPLSLGFLVAVCLWYYGRKAELEEALMVETFGERYTEYMAKVRYRLIPLLY